jgi:hypothetical protein
MDTYRYTVEWTFSETTTYRVTMDAETFASMANVRPEDLAGCGDSADAVLALDHELDNGLASMEDGTATEVTYDNERTVDSLKVRVRASAEQIPGAVAIHPDMFNGPDAPTMA